MKHNKTAVDINSDDGINNNDNDEPSVLVQPVSWAVEKGYNMC